MRFVHQEVLVMMGALFAIVSTALHACATDLVFISRDGSVHRSEEIRQVSLFHYGRPALEIIADKLTCSLEFASIEEALTIEERLRTSRPQWIQCFGDLPLEAAKKSALITTRRYAISWQPEMESTKPQTETAPPKRKSR